MDQVKTKINAQQAEGNGPGSPPFQGASTDHIWIWIGIPCLAISIFLSVFILSCVKKIFKLGLDQPQPPKVDIVEVPTNINL